MSISWPFYLKCKYAIQLSNKMLKIPPANFVLCYSFIVYLYTTAIAWYSKKLNITYNSYDLNSWQPKYGNIWILDIFGVRESYFTYIWIPDILVSHLNTGTESGRFEHIAIQKPNICKTRVQFHKLVCSIHLTIRTLRPTFEKFFRA